jgi:hypothetical protein
MWPLSKAQVHISPDHSNQRQDASHTQFVQDEQITSGIGEFWLFKIFSSALTIFASKAHHLGPINDII